MRRAIISGVALGIVRFALLSAVSATVSTT